MKYIYRRVLIIACLFLSNFTTFSQIAGFINRPSTSVGGRLVLDPNGDGYTSATTAGFGNDDVLNSELIYQGIKAYSIEPYGDLSRGPNHNYSDFVPDASGNGVYHRFSSGSNVMFRMRMGSIMPGSKGYSILMDTDGKFGATGPNADPNYQPTTTGTNGNPGFEIEVVLETNFRIAIYNVDGTSSPVLVKQYLNWQDMSQISIASTNDNGDPDFLIDFYIPFSDLQAAPFNLTAASPIRLCATTVMSPQAATGGPRSDIYGTGGNTYEDFIDGQPSCPIFNNPPNCTTAICTAAPVVNSPISTGTVSISGTWTKSVLTGSINTATISVYKNGSILLGTVTNVSSGTTWTLNNVILTNLDVITAKAQATGESMCLTSNAITATSCNSLNRPPQPVGFCADRKGFSATNYPAGAIVNIYEMTTSGQTMIFSEAVGGANIVSDGSGGWQVTQGCRGGNGNFGGGSYTCFYTLAGCDSKVSFACAVNTQGGWSSQLSPTPVINNASSIYRTTNSISGTAVTGSFLRIYVDDIFISSQTVVGTSWSYTFPVPLQVGQVISIRVQISDDPAAKIYYCSGLATATVVCYTQPPLINADNNNQITANAPITGTSPSPAGTIIRVYTSTNTLVATATVQANGTWSTGNAGTLPTTYLATAATAYYATAQNGSCGLSTNSASYTATAPTSAARCGSINGPISSGVGSISGTLTGSFTTSTVKLYLDGELIGTTTTNGTIWGPIVVNTTAANTLYSNGVLSIGIQETGKQEVACPASKLSILCTPTPTVPVYSLSGTTVNQNQTITCTITNAVIGTFYALSDSATGQSFGQGAWATTNGNLVLTSSPFSVPGTYIIKVSATSLSGLTLCKAVSAGTTIIVNPVVLPLNLLEFKGKKQDASIILDWTTASEIRVNRFEIERQIDGNTFEKIGTVMAAGNSSSIRSYTFTDYNPVKGFNYYRLKMIDDDGRFSYSKQVVFMGDAVDKISIKKIRPNPFTDLINIELYQPQPQMMTIQLIDLTGRVIVARGYNTVAGVNTIIFDGLAGLNKGLYVLKVFSSGIDLQQKVIKLQ